MLWTQPALHATRIRVIAPVTRLRCATRRDRQPLMRPILSRLYVRAGIQSTRSCCSRIASSISKGKAQEFLFPSRTFSKDSEPRIPARTSPRVGHGPPTSQKTWSRRQASASLPHPATCLTILSPPPTSSATSQRTVRRQRTQQLWCVREKRTARCLELIRSKNKPLNLLPV